MMTRIAAETMAKVHVSEVGTFHPDPNGGVQWTILDGRGTLDSWTCDGPNCELAQDTETYGDEEAEGGLEYVFMCLDGGEILCGGCAQSVVDSVECDCE